MEKQKAYKLVVDNLLLNEPWYYEEPIVYAKSAQERITKIANAKIPVSEESSVYNLFAQRREVCKKLLESQEGTYQDVMLTSLSYLEDNIKLYLCL